MQQVTLCCVCVCCVWEILEQNWGIGCVAGVIGVCVCVFLSDACVCVCVLRLGQFGAVLGE